MKRLLGLMLLMVVLVGCGVESAPVAPAVPAPDASAIKELMTPDQLALGDPVGSHKSLTTTAKCWECSTHAD